MKKRGVILGQPACVVWASVLAGVVFVILLCGLLFGVVVIALNGVMQNIHRSEDSSGVLGWYWAGWGAVLLVWWWLSSSSRRLKRRFRRLNGRVCLVCRREVGAGEAACSGCGTEWSLDGLGKSWKKAAGKK